MRRKIFNILIYIFALIGLAFSGVFILMRFHLLDVQGSIDDRNTFFGAVPKVDNTNGCLDASLDSTKEISCDWIKTREWQVVHDGLLKDANIIKRVATEVGVSPRMIAAAVVPEQIRFFTSNRESFKKYFEPLKILGSLTQFSLGVSGIKQETAKNIEAYANDPTSAFYPGDGIAALIKYTDGADHDQELFDRLTDSKNHYFSYLYTAIFLKEIQMQWENAGFDVTNRPDVLVTLFNLGFNASAPKPNPQVAGSGISVGGKNYSFGLLGTYFFNSGELLDIFPR